MFEKEVFASPLKETPLGRVRETPLGRELILH